MNYSKEVMREYQRKRRKRLKEGCPKEVKETWREVFEKVRVRLEELERRAGVNN